MAAPDSVLRTISIPVPSVLSMISPAKSDERESITCDTPISRRQARFSSVPAVAYTSAFACRASCSAARPTPPVAFVHQDAVAGGHPATYDKPETGRQKGHGQRGGGFFDTQVIRLPDDQAGLRGYVSSHGRRHHAHDQIARVYVTDLVAPRDYFSDAIPIRRSADASKGPPACRGRSVRPGSSARRHERGRPLHRVPAGVLPK